MTPEPTEPMLAVKIDKGKAVGYVLSVHTVWIGPGRLAALYAHCDNHAREIVADWLIDNTTTDAAGLPIRVVNR